MYMVGLCGFLVVSELETVHWWKQSFYDEWNKQKTSKHVLKRVPSMRHIRQISVTKQVGHTFNEESDWWAQHATF